MVRAQLIGDQVLMVFPKDKNEVLLKALVVSPDVHFAFAAVAAVGLATGDPLCTEGFRNDHGHDYFDNIIREDELCEPYRDHHLLMEDVKVKVPQVELTIKMLQTLKKVQGLFG